MNLETTIDLSISSESRTQSSNPSTTTRDTSQQSDSDESGVEIIKVVEKKKKKNERLKKTLSKLPKDESVVQMPEQPSSSNFQYVNGNPFKQKSLHFPHVWNATSDPINHSKSLIRNSTISTTNKFSTDFSNQLKLPISYAASSPAQSLKNSNGVQVAQTGYRNDIKSNFPTHYPQNHLKNMLTTKQLMPSRFIGTPSANLKKMMDEDLEMEGSNFPTHYSQNHLKKLKNLPTTKQLMPSRFIGTPSANLKEMKDEDLEMEDTEMRKLEEMMEKDFEREDIEMKNRYETWKKQRKQKSLESKTAQYPSCYPYTRINSSQSEMKTTLGINSSLVDSKSYQLIFPIISSNKWALRFIAGLQQLVVKSYVMSTSYINAVDEILKNIELEKVWYWLDHGSKNDAVDLLSAACASKNIVFKADPNFSKPDMTLYKFDIQMNDMCDNNPDYDRRDIRLLNQIRINDLFKKLQNIVSDFNNWINESQLPDPKLDIQRMKCFVDTDKLRFRKNKSRVLEAMVFDASTIESIVYPYPRLYCQGEEYNVEDFDEDKVLEAFDNLRNGKSIWWTKKIGSSWEEIGDNLDFRSLLAGVKEKNIHHVIPVPEIDREDIQSQPQSSNGSEDINEPEVEKTSDCPELLEASNDVNYGTRERRVRKKPVRYTDYVTDEDEDLMTEHDKGVKRATVKLKQSQRNRKVGKKCKRPDLDYNAEENQSSSEDSPAADKDDDKFTSDNETQPEEITSIEALENIQQSVPLTVFDFDFQRYFRQSATNRTGRKIKYLKIDTRDDSHGLRASIFAFTKFIHFMLINKIGTNPFDSNIEDALEFLQVLYDANVDLDTINNCRNGIRLVTIWENDIVRQSFLERSSKMGPTSIMVDNNAEKKYKEYSDFKATHVLQGFNQYVIWCLHNKLRNPYLTSPSQILLFLFEVYLHLTSISAVHKIHPVLLNIVNALDIYHSIGFMKCQKLSDVMAVKYFLGCVDACDHSLMHKFQTVMGYENGIKMIIPPYKYAGYVTRYQDSASYWKEAKVAELLRFIFGDTPTHYNQDKHGPKMSLTQGAVALGVTVEMLMVGYTKFKMFNTSHKSKLKYNYGEYFFNTEKRENADLFWELPHTKKIIQDVRERTISITDGAFMIGVSRKEFNYRVGPLVPIQKEVKKNIIKPKVNPLQKQLACLSDEEEMTEYERIRKKNIADRLALFQQLEFGDIKECAAKSIVRREKIEIKPRAKSSRIQQKKMKLESEKHVQEKDEYKWQQEEEREMVLPPITIALDETTALHIPWKSSRQFLSYMQQEICYKSSEQNISTKKEEIKNDEVNVDDECSFKEEKTCENELIVHAVCNSITPYSLTSAAIYPDDSLSLICVGDTTGCLGIWVPGSNIETYENENPIGRNCLFKPHSERINSISFNTANNSKVITCSDDGFIRQIDLAQGYQTIDLVYDWGRHGREIEYRPIFSCQSLSKDEYIISKKASEEVMSFLLYDSRKKEIAMNLIPSTGECLLPRISINPADMLTVSTIGEDCVCLYDLRMSCEYKKLNYTVKIPCLEPTQADFSTNGSNELLICSKKESLKSNEIVKDANIYHVNELVNLETNVASLVPSRNITNISQVYKDKNCSTAKYRGSFQNHSKMLPNAMCSNQAVWHPSIPGATVISKCYNKGKINEFHQIDVVSNDEKLIAYSSMAELPSECHNLISSVGGIGLLNSRVDGTITIFK